MKKYLVTVNGTKYEVEIEELDATQVDKTKKAPVEKPAEKAPEKPAPKLDESDSAKGILAPMPGTILTVNAVPGKSFKKGEVLFVLEAMKMENEIMAPDDCVIDTVIANKGASVKSGDILCIVK